MRRSGFAVSSRHGPPGGTGGGDTAGGEEATGRLAVRKTGRPLSSNRPAGNTRWTRRGSNPRPSACKAAAPPIELLARIDIYNIPIQRRERNRKIPSPSYLRNSSNVAKQAGDRLYPPRSPSRHRSPSKLIVECGARRLTGRCGEEAGGEIDWTVRKTGRPLLKQSSRVIYGGPSGTPTRDLRRATPLLSRLSYWPVSVYIIYHHGNGNATEKYRLHHICATRRMMRSKQTIFCFSPFLFPSSLPVQANRRMHGEAIYGEIWRRGRRGEMERIGRATRMGDRRWAG